ncbi:MAG: hypothetical protein AB3N23_08190 [Paracoccaceae bacterium]
MTHTPPLWPSVLAAFTCLALVVWSVLPSFTHAPTVFETIHEHLEMVEDHGHSHGFAEDLLWAMHGHNHDASDHDHSQAYLLPEYTPTYAAAPEDVWRPRVKARGPSRHFPIERPPRV